jgi:hypothetical protein
MISDVSTTLNPVNAVQTLKKDRALVTLFAKSGQVVTTSIENFILFDQSTNPATAYLDRNAPYRDAQLGVREAK